MKKRHPRLVAPLAPLAPLVAGTMVAGAVAIGHTWVGAIVTEVVTVIVSFMYYLLTGRDSDVGAIYGQRSDERQTEVRLKAIRLAFYRRDDHGIRDRDVMVAFGGQYWQEDVLWAWAVSRIFSVSLATVRMRVADSGRRESWVPTALWRSRRTWELTSTDKKRRRCCFKRLRGNGSAFKDVWFEWAERSLVISTSRSRSLCAISILGDSVKGITKG
jgi:hypothetical protein